MTDSMQNAINETNRRRKIQQEYNEKHGITPTTIKKAVRDLIRISKDVPQVKDELDKDMESMSEKELNKLISEYNKKMHKAAADLNFEEAAQLRDLIIDLKKHLLEVTGE